MRLAAQNPARRNLRSLGEGAEALGPEIVSVTVERRPPAVQQAMTPPEAIDVGLSSFLRQIGSRPPKSSMARREEYSDFPGIYAPCRGSLAG